MTTCIYIYEHDTCNLTAEGILFDLDTKKKAVKCFRVTS